MESNVEHFAKAVAELSLPRGMPRLLQIIAAFPGLIERVFESIDIKLASERWPHSLADHRSDESRVAREVLRYVSQRNSAELGQLADRLVRSVRYKQSAKGIKGAK